MNPRGVRPGEMGVSSIYGSKRREVLVAVGDRYLVEPQNPSARRHRGRVVTVVMLPDERRDTRVTVRFSDSGRTGKVEAADLVRCSPE